MNPNAKRNIKNAAKTGGKYVLSGIKLAGIGVLSTSELASRGIGKIAKSRHSRRLLAKGLTVGASVAFATPMVMMAGMSYMVNNSVLGRDQSAVDALLAAPRALNKILDNVLDVAAVPTAAIAKGVEKASKKGKEALEDR